MTQQGQFIQRIIYDDVCTFNLVKAASVILSKSLKIKRVSPSPLDRQYEANHILCVSRFRC